MYWNFYLILTKIFSFMPLLFWIFHIILVIVFIKVPRKPGTILFLIPGALFAFHDIRWEALNGPFECNMIFVIIEIILMIIGAIVVMGSSGDPVFAILNLLLSFLQGYIFGVICIFLLVWFVDSIIVLAIGIFVLFMAGALIFSK